jgi:hypothetical protein
MQPLYDDQESRLASWQRWRQPGRQPGYKRPGLPAPPPARANGGEPAMYYDSLAIGVRHEPGYVVHWRPGLPRGRGRPCSLPASAGGWPRFRAA